MAKLSNLRHFLRDVVNMSGAEAGSYTNLVRKAGVNTDEQEVILLSHLKDKYRQGSVGGDHFDDNLDDVFKSALGVRSFGGDTGLGGRVYSAGDLHSKVKLKSHKEQVLQDRQLGRGLRVFKRKLEKFRGSAIERRDHDIKRTIERAKESARDTTKAWSSERTPARSINSSETDKFMPTSMSSQYIRQNLEQGIAPDTKYMSEIVNGASGAISSDVQKAREIAQSFRGNVLDRNKLERDAAAKANIETSSQRAMNYRLTGDQENVLGTVTPEGQVLRETNEIRNTKKFQDAYRRNIQDEIDRKAEETRKAEALATRQKQEEQYAAARTQHQKDLEDAAKEESDLRNSAAFQVAQKRQEALATGSGKSVQESANSAAAADMSGGPVDMTIDRAMLRQKMGGDKTTWGRKDAEEYLLNNVTKKLEDQQLAIAQNKKLTSEQKLSEWNKHKKEAEDILAEGPGFGDYFFGNKLHYGIGGAAFAAAVGSQAFGGHKSNAELYSSPF